MRHPSLRVLSATALLLTSAVTAQAQDRVTVFLHGFNSSSATWHATAARLQARLQIAPYLPDLPWFQPFDAQAAGLNNAANGAGAPPNTVVVGHSNGGLVARQLSTKRPLGGLVTLGSPHGGAPLARNFWAAGLQYSFMGQDLGLLLTMLGATNGTNRFTSLWFSPALAPVRAVVASLGVLLQQASVTAGYVLFASADVPVLADMRPGSAALAALNGGANLGRERTAVPRRVGMVFTARDWWVGGPFAAAAPERRYTAQSVIDNSLVVVGLIRAYFDYPNFPPFDPVISTIRNQASRVISDLLVFNAVWCGATSDDLTCSTSTDGVVPTPAQYFPGDAVNLGYYGPAHLEQTAASEEGLADVLTRYIGLATRGASNGDPGGPAANLLTAGARLYPDQFVRSPNGAWTLLYQTDGNLVFYGPAGPVWSSGTYGRSAGHATMQGDGNFVVYDLDGVPWWSTDTHGSPGAQLRVQDDGYLVLTDAGGATRWYAPQ